MKTGQNSSQWTKFDPLTTNIFEFTTLAVLDTTKFVDFHKSTPMWSHSHTEVKSHFIFSEISTLNLKIEKFGQIWVVDAGNMTK